MLTSSYSRGAKLLTRRPSVHGGNRHAVGPSSDRDGNDACSFSRQKKKEHIWFVTNIDATEETVYAYAQALRRRWGIETSYRKITEYPSEQLSRTARVKNSRHRIGHSTTV